MIRITAASLLLLVFSVVPTFAKTPQIAIMLRNHRFVPAEVTAPAGTRIELRVHNAQKTSAEFESSSLHREQVVTPGATIRVYVGPLSAGRYEFFDDFHPATRGHLVVK
jgi:plastocyanin